MADYNSSLPVRTETNGDVAAKIVDGTVVSQTLSVDASGKIFAKLNDQNGVGIDSQALVGAQFLDVVNPSNGPASPGTASAYSNLAGGIYHSSPITLTNGQQASLQLDVNGRLLVTTTSTDDHNYGTVGANTLRTAAQIGNATGAADFNFGVVGAQTLRVAGQIGNATGAADFNAGATGAQTLRVSANQGAPNTVANAWPILLTDGVDTVAVNTDGSINVVVTDATPGTPINDYKRAVGVAVGATDNHDYTVTAGKTFYLNQIESSASGKAKMQVDVETGVATGVFITRWSQFNSTATPQMSIHIDNPIAVAAGVRVRLVMTNKDVAAEDIYSTISGYELP